MSFILNSAISIYPLLAESGRLEDDKKLDLQIIEPVWSYQGGGAYCFDRVGIQ